MIATIYKARNIIRKRKAHSYCIGAAKTGTTSLAQMMSQVSRSAHEPLVQSTNNLVIDYLSGKLTNTEVEKELIYRDSKLFLEFESSHQLGYLAHVIAKVFPESKFIVTIRNPKSWLKSRLNFHHFKNPPEWKRYRNFIWNRHKKPYHSCESYLEERGLFPIATYLSQYSEQYNLIFNKISHDRTLIIDTVEINNSFDKLCKFIEIPYKKVKLVNTNSLQPEENVIQFLPEEFIEEQIEQYCKDLQKYL